MGAAYLAANPFHGEEVMSALNTVRDVVRSYSYAPDSKEMELLNGMPDGDAKNLEIARMKLAKHQELMSFISNVMKQLHEMSMSVINNMR